MTGKLSEIEIYRLLSLVSVFGGGVNRLWDTVNKTGSFNEAYEALFKAKSRAIFTSEEIKSAERVHENQIQGIISYCESHNIGMLCYNDLNYPKRLKNIFSPPALLFYRGNLRLLNNEAMLAVVGARRISPYTEKVTKFIAGKLAMKGITIVSGFAVGADIASHLSAVRSGGKTVAVLGCGLDYPYPAANQIYTEEILANGLFISEYFPTAAANPMNFIARNRILAGISDGVIVTEASDRSGAVNIANYALSQGKDIWVVPPSDIMDNRYNGTKRLLYDGAIPIYYADDVIREYFGKFTHKPFQERNSDFSDISDDKKTSSNAENNENEAPDVPEPEPEPQEPEPIPQDPELVGLDKLVYDVMKKAGRPVSADEIAELSGIDVFDLLGVLTGLEIAGLISSETGQTYYIL